MLIAISKYLLRLDRIFKAYVVFVPYPTRTHSAPRKHIYAKKDVFITKTCVRQPHSLTLLFAWIKYSHTRRKIQKTEETAMLILRHWQRRCLEAR